MRKLFWSLLAAAFTYFAALGVAWAVEVNTATKAELEAVSGIGPKLADRIIAERGKGQFKDSEDLQKRVKGLGPKNTAKMIAAGLTVGGRAVSAPPAKKASAKAASAAAADQKPVAAKQTAAEKRAAAKAKADAKKASAAKAKAKASSEKVMREEKKS